MKTLLFLDMDGVVNNHAPLCEAKCGQIHKDKVHLLNQVLRKTGADIVMSSAWRYLVFRQEMNLKGLEWLLRSHGVITGRLVGITRKDTEVEQPADWNGDLSTWVVNNERGQQITDWLAEHIGEDGVANYAVVDDLDLGITQAGHPFVQTDGSVGLTEADAKRLTELLGGEW